MDTRHRAMGAWALCAAGGMCVLTGAAEAQPANDHCANATPITLPGLYTSVIISGTTSNATSDIAQTCGDSDSLDVWYTFTAPVAGRYSFDTSNSLLYDTTLAVYASCGGAQLACNDNYDADNFQFWSAITIDLAAAQTIKVRVSATFSDSDDFNLNVVGTGPFTNDPCGTPDTLLLGQTKSASTLRATTDFSLPAASCGPYVGSGGGRDVFYAFTPPATGDYGLWLCGSTFDTVLAVLTNCSGSAASVVACNDNSTICAEAYSSAIPHVTLTGGVRYLVRVAGYDFNPPDSGTFTLVATSSNASTGLCCRGSTCAVIPSSSCTVASGAAGAHFIQGFQCNAAGVGTTPCCFADYNKMGGINVQDIFAYLSDWFAGNGYANFGSNGSDTPTVASIFQFLSVWFGGCS